MILKGGRGCHNDDNLTMQSKNRLPLQGVSPSRLCLPHDPREQEKRLQQNSTHTVCQNASALAPGESFGRGEGDYLLWVLLMRETYF